MTFEEWVKSVPPEEWDKLDYPEGYVNQWMLMAWDHQQKRIDELGVIWRKEFLEKTSWSLFKPKTKVRLWRNWYQDSSSMRVWCKDEVRVGEGPWIICGTGGMPRLIKETLVEEFEIE